MLSLRGFVKTLEQVNSLRDIGTSRVTIVKAWLNYYHDYGVIK